MQGCYGVLLRKPKEKEMKQITLASRKNINGARWGPGFNIVLLTEADEMDGEFENTIRLLRTILSPRIEIFTADITHQMTHRFVATPIRKPQSPGSVA